MPALAERPRPRDLAAAAVGIAIAAGLLAWAFRHAGAGALAAALLALSPGALLPALLCEAAVQCSKALKWTALLRGVEGAGRVRYGSALRAVVVGAASTHLVPLRMDELLRAAVLARREGMEPAAVLGTVAVDRLLEILVVGVLLGALAAVAGLPPWMRAGAGALWAVFLGGALVLALFLRHQGALQERMARSSLPLLPQAALLTASLARGMRSLPRGRALPGVLAGAAGEWGATLLFYAWMLRVFGESGHGAALPLALSLGNSVAYAVPNVPGALGTYEALQSGILERLGGLGRAEALGLALAAHAVLMVPVTLAGLAVGALEWRRRP